MAYSDSSYRRQIDTKLEDDLKLKKAELPAFCKTFFNSTDTSISIRTKISYAMDMRVFFKWVIQSNPAYSKYEIKDLPFECIENLTSLDIDEYMMWLSNYDDEGIKYRNDLKAKKRKLSTLRSFFRFYVEKNFLKFNPAADVRNVKLEKTLPTVLDEDEVKAFLSIIEYGSGLTDKALEYHEKTKTRDLAIFTILLNTGIRISELVGLNLNDFDFDKGEFRVIRKGNKEDIIPYNEAVEDILFYYLDYDRGNFTEDDEEQALFLSLQKKRITVKAVENLCKKYSEIAVPLKKITPHKLRSTFGTKIYNDTGDIYLTADLLGHSSVDTTKRYYASINTQRKRDAVRNFSYNN